MRDENRSEKREGTGGDWKGGANPEKEEFRLLNLGREKKPTRLVVTKKKEVQE